MNIDAGCRGNGTAGAPAADAGSDRRAGPRGRGVSGTCQRHWRSRPRGHVVTSRATETSAPTSHRQMDRRSSISSGRVVLSYTLNGFDDRQGGIPSCSEAATAAIRASFITQQMTHKIKTNTTIISSCRQTRATRRVGRFHQP